MSDDESDDGLIVQAVPHQAQAVAAPVPDNAMQDIDAPPHPGGPVPLTIPDNIYLYGPSEQPAPFTPKQFLRDFFRMRKRLGLSHKSMQVFFAIGVNAFAWLH